MQQGARSMIRGTPSKPALLCNPAPQPDQAKCVVAGKATTGSKVNVMKHIPIEAEAKSVIVTVNTWANLEGASIMVHGKGPLPMRMAGSFLWKNLTHHRQQHEHRNQNTTSTGRHMLRDVASIMSASWNIDKGEP
jgi:hypothetical protein